MYPPGSEINKSMSSKIKYLSCGYILPQCIYVNTCELEWGGTL
jgi:hypothetical protein